MSKITQNRGLYTNNVLDYDMKAYVFAFCFVHMCHCVFIRHGVSGDARLRLPWCTSSLCSAVWEQCAALSASLVPLGSLPHRQGLALFPFLYFRPLSLFHSLFNTHWALRSTSFAPISAVRCLLPSFLIRYETLLHLLILPLPLAPVFKNVKPLPVCIFLVTLTLLWASLVPLLLSTLHLSVNLPLLDFFLLSRASVYMVLLLFFALPLCFWFTHFLFPIPLLTSTSHWPFYFILCRLIPFLHLRLTSLLSVSFALFLLYFVFFNKRLCPRLPIFPTASLFSESPTYCIQNPSLKCCLFILCKTILNLYDLISSKMSNEWSAKCLFLSYLKMQDAFSPLTSNLICFLFL